MPDDLSANPYRALLEIATDALVVVDADGEILSVNESAEELFGYPAGELIGLELEVLVPNRLRDAHRKHRRAYVERPVVRPMGTGLDLVARRKDGSEVPIEISLSPLVGERGVEVVAAVRDVSASRERERRLHAAEGRYRVLAARAPVGVFQTDAAGTTDYVNDRLAQITGHGPSDLLGIAWWDALHPDVREQVMASWEAAVADGEPWRGELRFQHPDGRVVWGFAEATPVRDPDGAVVSYVGTVTDVSELKEDDERIRALNAALERRVSQRTAELEGAVRELESFSYSVSHDLRAPLRHVAGFAEQLRRHYAADLDERGARWLDVIVGSAERMTRLIDDLLAFSRSARGELQKTWVDLGAEVRKAIEGLTSETRDREVHWRVDEPLQVWADPGLLHAVLMNLLGNAVKFSRDREPAEIRIGNASDAADGEGSEGHDTFFVADNGVGFDPRYADRLFAVFQRLHHEEEFEGTGIGLAEVQRIVRRHGGRVWARGRVDEGATFYVSLPRPEGGSGTTAEERTP